MVVFHCSWAPLFWILGGTVNNWLSVIVTCTEEEFKCGSTQLCIEKTKLCNGRKDCPNGEDEEQNCGKLIALLSSAKYLGVLFIIKQQLLRLVSIILLAYVNCL